jgi:16S rRNA (guanine527-N7)-methyltransferase
VSPADRHTTRSDSPLVEALSTSQRLGMLGSGPVREFIEHSAAFVDALRGVTGTVVDLGSGGGVPGLVIAWRRPDLQLVLVDRRVTRTDHLQRLVTRLGLGEHVIVRTAEARALPHLLDDPVAAVVARGFGKPRDVIGAALPILSVGGLVVVSEPPRGPDRWSEAIGTDLIREASDRRVAVLRRVPRGTSPTVPPSSNARPDVST